MQKVLKNMMRMVFLHNQKNIKKDKQWQLDQTGAGVIPITAIREPEVPGTHTVDYTSEVDTISITHQAHNRMGFALGAVIAAEWLYGKQGVFNMKDVLDIN